MVHAFLILTIDFWGLLWSGRRNLIGEGKYGLILNLLLIKMKFLQKSFAPFFLDRSWPLQNLQPVKFYHRKQTYFKWRRRWPQESYHHFKPIIIWQVLYSCHLLWLRRSLGKSEKLFYGKSGGKKLFFLTGPSFMLWLSEIYRVIF